MTPWTANPTAAALLLDCAQNPPRIIHRRKAYAITADTWCEFDPEDRRIQKLEAIRERWMSEVWTPALAGIEGNGGREHMFDCAIEVFAAIDAIPEAVAHSTRRHAA